MKIRIFSILFVISFVLSALPVYAANEIGRYQLFQGEYRFINLKGEEHWSKALFKLDTATGKMYICEQDQVLGKHLKKKGEAYQRRYCKEFDENLEIPDYTKNKE